MAQDVFTSRPNAWSTRIQGRLRVFLGLLLLAASGARMFAQDIVLSDFEETNYTWLPGGTWTATGGAFGEGPAQGTLTNQNSVTGYLGNGLVNSYLSGDTNQGTLTSPSFTIHRKYIRFLIGGGNWRDKTCINLLVNGQVVRSAVGMGDRENLDWLQWNVADYLNQSAQLQIADSTTGDWGHVNIDQILETDAPLSNTIVASQHFLNLPVQSGATGHLVELLQNGLVVREFNIELADTATNFYAFMDLTSFQGQELSVRVDSQLATPDQLARYFVQTNQIITDIPIYQEALRPVFHFSTRRGWINDPNGLVYLNGKYHLSCQHNPYGCQWNNMHWANAVSTDLVHWAELPEALYPDWHGAAWSGSSVVDVDNSAGFGTNAMVSFYTEAAGHANNPRMSQPYRFTQGLACSLDSGRTFIPYTNNPIVPNVAGDNRDPRVIWYAPGKKWVMVFWLINNDFGFFSSTDLKHWTQTSTYTFPDVIEVPELFPLPLDGDTNNLKWIFYAGAGHYYAGKFDGDAFTAEAGPYGIRGGNCFAAGQTFSDVPATDGRRILIANGTQTYPGMPFNEALDFPVELTLQTVNGSPQMLVNPVREIALLRNRTNSWPDQILPDGIDILAGTTGEACEMDGYFRPGNSSREEFNFRGTSVIYDNLSHQISCLGITNSLAPNGGIIHLHALVDRGMLEIYANDGLVYMPMTMRATAGPLPLGLVAHGSGAQLISLRLYNLGSAWPAQPPFIAAQPVSVTNLNAGGSAVLTVNATGTTLPFYYQWQRNGQPIVGATNNVLSVFPGSGTNVNYDVIISNTAGSVTSAVATVTFPPPYIAANWRMESQATTPNSAGGPAFNGVLDSAISPGQGLMSVGVVPAQEDDLITFNALPGGVITLSPDVAPPAMFVNGHNGGKFSYNAEAISAVDGALFFPQDQYGDEFDFTGPFAIEMFFKTDGNQSAAGPMQLLSQGSDMGQTFRYGINVNGTAPGAVRFDVANSSWAQTNGVGLAGMSYADGQWHYLQAVCDAAQSDNGQLRLTIVNQDGSESSATNDLPSGFLPLPAQNNGNLFIGRYSYPAGPDARTFLGLIDEVQITSGPELDTWRVGKIPSRDNYFKLNSVSVQTKGLSLQWSGAAATNFIVQWVPKLGDAWQSLATLASVNSDDTFLDTNLARFTGSAGFYRILSQ
jgi:fructan beta-fructosidase